MKGLKVGLEFHQRLDSEEKLFCSCSSDLHEKPHYLTVERKLRPVLSELGKVDIVAKIEAMKNKTYKYLVTPENTCLVELDEEPPHEVDKEALKISLKLGKMLNINFVDELHFMRKTVIDGSNTSGFQRTGLLGKDGYFYFNKRKIPIWYLILEEEAAGIVEKKRSETTYRLDRLGIPLVEIVTGIIESTTPKEVKDIALYLGTMLRTTGNVKRGIGTIRQDTNVSVPGGSRCEIKGLQDISLLDTVVEKEAERQKSLIKLKQEIKSRNLKPQKFEEMINVSEFFKNSKLKFLKGSEVYGIALQGFEGLLGFNLTEERRFGTELADITKLHGLGGLIHSDENMTKYGINKNEIFKKMGGDSFILLATSKEKAEKVFPLIIGRINKAYNEVPTETRNILLDGNSRYMRPLATSARMYPETDIPPVKITGTKSINIPDKPEEIQKQLMKKYNLNKQFASSLVTSVYSNLFYKIAKVNKDYKLIADTLLNKFTELKREGFDVDAIPDKKLVELFKKDIDKKAIPKALKILSKNIDANLSQFERIDIDKSRLDNEIRLLLKKHKDMDEHRKKNVVMGEMMKKYRGKVSGKLISELLEKLIK